MVYIIYLRYCFVPNASKGGWVNTKQKVRQHNWTWNMRYLCQVGSLPNSPKVNMVSWMMKRQSPWAQVHTSVKRGYFILGGWIWASSTIKKAEHQRNDAFKLWCWRRLWRVPSTAKRSNQSILKEINPEYSWEGLMLKLKLQYFGHLIANRWLTRKDPDSGKDWGQEEKRMTEDEMVGWHHWLNGHEFEQALGDSEAWSAAVHGSQRVKHDLTTEQQQPHINCLIGYLALGFLARCYTWQNLTLYKGTWGHFWSFIQDPVLGLACPAVHSGHMDCLYFSKSSRFFFWGGRLCPPCFMLGWQCPPLPWF